MMQSPEEFTSHIRKLADKYDAMGQDLKSYLSGLLYSNFPNYWDYIKVDTLLSLQQPLTAFPDEMIFIGYHQITEIYFRLMLHEIEQIANNGRIVEENGRDLGWKTELDVGFFIERLKRINRYFKNLSDSFDVVVDGMEKEQFLKFRMSLLPGSGFQSLQFRLIEIGSTDLTCLVDAETREKYAKGGDTEIESLYENLYWKKGATELASGKKTLTATLFEKKYREKMISAAREFRTKNIRAKYNRLSEQDKKNPELIIQLKRWDQSVNLLWPLSHYRSAVRHLSNNTEYIKATGGTNWQKYLPPKFQGKIFFPELWKPDEKANWGRFDLSDDSNNFSNV